MIAAGPLDRRITIQRQDVSQSESGAEVVRWVDVATVYAKKKETAGYERFASAQFVGRAAKQFLIRWSSEVAGITTKHRVIFDGREHDIVDVREVGRREGIELDCTVRSEVQMVNT